MSDIGTKRPFPEESMETESDKRLKTAEEGGGEMGENGSDAANTNGEGGEGNQKSDDDFTTDATNDFTKTSDGWEMYNPQAGGPRGRGRFPRPPFFRGMRPPPRFMMRGWRGPPPRGFFRGPPPPPPPFFFRPRPPPPIAPFLNPKNMTIDERLEAFGQYLSTIEQDRAPPVTTLFNASCTCRLSLNLDYTVEEMEPVAGRPMFTGLLTINDQYIVRDIGPNKKELKQEVYRKAIDIIMNRPGLEIVGTEDPGPEKIKREMEEKIQAEAAKDLETFKEFEPESNAPCDDAETMTALEKISGILKNTKYYMDNEINRVDKAINQTTPRPPHEYFVEELKLANGRLYFVGLLRFGPLIIGRGNGFNKKACKLDTFQKAFKHLTTKNLEELAYSLPEEPKLEIDKINNTPRKLKAMSRELPLEERLGEFLKAMATPDPNSYVKTIDVAAFHCSLSLIIMYKCKPTNHLKPAMDIDMFLEDMHVAHHSGSMKRDCMQAAYQQAWEYLSKQTVEGLLKNANKVNRDDLWGPYMVTVARKGNGSTIDSNVTNLKRYGHDLSKISNNKLEDLVILEQGEVSQDRQKNCVSIMNLSCMHNGLLLQWETESILNTYSTVNARCQVFIQRQKVGESYGVGKAQAKELAFREALFKFYETQPVIRMVTEGDDKNWISYETLQKEGEELEKRGIKPDLPIRDEEGNFLSSYITKCAYEKIKRFAEKKKGEIIFGPGMTSDEGKEIRFIGRMLNLKCDIRSHEGHPYMLFFKHIEWAKLVGRLSPTAGLYGKYFRVPNDKVPKYAEVRDQILKQPHKQMQDYTVTMDEETEVEKPAPVQPESMDFTSEDIF